MNEESYINEGFEQAEMKKEIPTKWLRMLFYLHLASLAAMVISWLPVPDGGITWVRRAIDLGAVISLFALAGANPRYRKAAIFAAVSLGCLLVTRLLSSSTILPLAGSVFSILALYQEYSGHSELVEQADPKLSRNWHSLFNWNVIGSVLLAFATMFAAVLFVAAEVETDTVVAIIAVMVGAFDLVIGIIYLRFIDRTAKLLEA